jgi:hypothetical protein
MLLVLRGIRVSSDLPPCEKGYPLANENDGDDSHANHNRGLPDGSDQSEDDSAEEVQARKEEPQNTGQGKRDTLYTHWKKATPLTQLELVIAGVVAVAGILTCFYYLLSYIQTQRNFNRDHRASLVVDIQTIHTTTSVLDATLENPGHSIAENIVIHANEATFNLNSLDGSTTNRMINGWGEFTLPPISPASGKTIFNIPLPGLDIERIKSGTQYIYVGVRISYVDEASGDKETVPPICMRSVPVEPVREVIWQRCDAAVNIPQMEKWDENENPKYRWPIIP